jgi:hypothetical protein
VAPLPSPPLIFFDTKILILKWLVPDQVRIQVRTLLQVFGTKGFLGKIYKTVWLEPTVLSISHLFCYVCPWFYYIVRVNKDRVLGVLAVGRSGH